MEPAAKETKFGDNVADTIGDSEIIKPPDLRLLKAYEDNKNITKFLRENPDVDVNEKDIWGTTCLSKACSKWDEVTIELLMAHPKIDINLCSGGQTPFQCLIQRYCQRGRTDITRDRLLDHMLKDERLDINYVNKSTGQNVLHFLLSYHDYRTVEKLLTQKTSKPMLDVNVKDRDKRPAWSLLSNDRSEEGIAMLRLIVEHESFDVNSTNGQGKTLLMTLICDRYMADIINLLLNNKQINVNRANEKKWTIMHYVYDSYGHLQDPSNDILLLSVARRIRKIDTFDIDVDATDTSGKTLLMLAVEKASENLVRFTVEELKADTNCQDKEGNTALMLSNNADITKLLLQYSDTDIHIMNNKYSTIMRQAIQKNDTKLIKELKQRDSYDVNRVYDDGKTDLMWLFHTGLDNITEIAMDMLEDPHCDVKVTDPNNDTVFHSIHGKMELFETFVKHPSYNASVLNQQDKFKRTFMHNFCGANLDTLKHISLQQRGEMVEVITAILQDPVIDMNVQDHVGFTPLMVAASSGNTVVQTVMLNLLAAPERFDFTKHNCQSESASAIAKQNPYLDDGFQRILKAHAPQDVVSDCDMSIPELLKFLRKSINKHAHLAPDYKEEILLLLDSVESDIKRFCDGSPEETLEMKREHRDKLRGCRMYLIKNLSTVEVTNYLYQEKILTETQMEEVKEERSSSARVIKFLSIIQTRGPMAYEKFIDSLRETEQVFIAEKLQLWDPSTGDQNEIAEGASSAVALRNPALLSEMFLQVSQALSQQCRQLTDQ